MRDAGWVDHPILDDEATWVEGREIDADQLAEFAGRMCYQSWERPNPQTATNHGYLKHILEVGHESILEHSSATFYVAEVSRALSHELVRHRHLSFSQLSQRFVDEADVIAIIPPAIEDADASALNGLKLSSAVGASMRHAQRFYGELVVNLIAQGFSRKQAREAARCVLPNSTETRFVVSGNLRAWREVILKRASAAADAEMQRFALAVLRHLQTLAPNTFQEFSCGDCEPLTATVSQLPRPTA